MAAVLDGRDAVVMSNEWSASIPTLEVDGPPVNHQYSKSVAFEGAFREVLAGALGPDFAYFSALRPFSELWVARRFAALTQYHDTFRSCNRAFHIDKSLRLDHWCGRCDKCCFIDLILAPFVPAADLERIFGGHEPLAATTPTPMPAPGWPTSSAPCSAPPPPASRSSAWARSASAGPRRCSPRSGPTGPAPSCSRCWPPSWTACPSCPPRPNCSARSATTSSRMLCARRSPGLTCARGTRRGQRPGGLWGLGVEGLANLARLRSLGAEPVLVDDHPPAGGVDGLPVLATAGGGLAALAAATWWSSHRASAATATTWPAGGQRGIPVAGRPGPVAPGGGPRPGAVHHRHQGQEQHHRHRGAPAQPAGATGAWSAGTSASRRGTRAGGAAYDYWVIETSSYQATDLGCSPPVVAVTSLHPDHLHWHRRRGELLPGQAVRVLPAGRGPDRGQRGQRPAPGPGGAARPAGGVGARGRRPGRGLDGAARPAGRAQPAQRPDRPGLPARPGRAAGRTTRPRCATPPRGSQPLSSRLQAIGTVAGVTFVDDSLSTNVLPTLAALDAFPGRRVALIAGGQDRGIDYAPLAAGLRRPARAHAGAGRAGQRPAHRGRDRGRPARQGRGDRPARTWTRRSSGASPGPGRTACVLLSPAAPSFGQFRDYRDRGDAFARAMRACSAG